MQSPIGWITTLVLGQFLAEFLIMFLLHRLPPLSPLQDALADSTLLCLSLGPLYYFLLYRPWSKVAEEARKTQEALRNSKAKYLAIFECAASPTLILREDLTIAMANRAFETLTGYPRGELEEKKGLNDFLKDLGPLGPNGLESLLADCPPPDARGHSPVETSLTDRSGKIRQVSIALSRIEETQMYAVSLWDITRRKEIEEALRSSQEKLVLQHEELEGLFQEVERAKQEWEKTMDCVDDLVILTDAKGIIKRHNRALSTFLGKKAISKGENIQNLLQEYEVNFSDVSFQGMEILNRATGQWFVLRVYPFLADGHQISGMVITAHDFTDRKQTTQQLERSNGDLQAKGEELERAMADLKESQARVIHQEKMASLGQLSAGVAHEINNPMGFISSNLGTLEKYVDRLVDFIETQAEVLAEEGGEEALAALNRQRQKLKLEYICRDARELIRESLEGTDRVKRIVQSMKSFSRADQAVLKLVDIRECLESTINIVWNELKYKATLVREYGELPPIYCYPQELNQVFMNLLINAVHAIEKQGEITVKTWHEENTALIAVSDTGCGIRPEQMKKLFDPFFTTKEVGKGTGLGLSISYEIVKRHSGEIKVRSEVDRGTTFTVSLPLNVKAEEMQALGESQ